MSLHAGEDNAPADDGGLRRRRLRVSIGIFAHNESETIAEAIEAFLQQDTALAQVAEILVVCCGCTDNTVEIATSCVERDSRVQVIVRKEQAGKVAAINEFLNAARSETVILSGADVIAGGQLVDSLVRPMIQDARCAMTGPKIVCTAPPQRSLAATLHALLWRLHHEVARYVPKLGETVAVRRSLLPPCLPSGIHCDEVLMEWLVLKQGGHLKYVTGAWVRNFPPRRIRHLYRQRRRIACQHVAARRILRYRPATSQFRNALLALIKVARTDWRTSACLAVLCVVELAARIHGRIDFQRGRRYRTWRAPERDVRPEVPEEPSHHGPEQSGEEVAWVPLRGRLF